MSTELAVIDFHGDQLQALQDTDGTIWAALKPMCDSLGVSLERQRKKLKNKPWATAALRAAVGSDGKNREMYCLQLRSVPMWLATIEPARVAVTVRRKLTTYQQEAADVLARHFLAPSTTLAPPAWQHQIDDLMAQNAETRHLLKAFAAGMYLDEEDRDPRLAQLGTAIREASVRYRTVANRTGDCFAALSGKLLARLQTLPDNPSYRSYTQIRSRHIAYAFEFLDAIVREAEERATSRGAPMDEWRGPSRAN